MNKSSYDLAGLVLEQKGLLLITQCFLSLQLPTCDKLFLIETLFTNFYYINIHTTVINIFIISK